MGNEPSDDRKQGPKGGIKHTPGRGHARKSGPNKKKRFQRKAVRKWQAQETDSIVQWAEWDALPPDVQKLLPDKKPDSPRPANES